MLVLDLAVLARKALLLVLKEAFPEGHVPWAMVHFTYGTETQQNETGAWNLCQLSYHDPFVSFRLEGLRNLHF